MNVHHIPDQEFKEWFGKIDKDGDGKIDMAEMAHNLEDFVSRVS
jgi:Ca2+-binding EF-hand superfamily protein